jgi:hypothetical protein
VTGSSDQPIPPRPDSGLSLAAELLLLSFDPGTRALLPTRRGRLEHALGAADVEDAGDPEESSTRALRRRGRRARRRALAELRAARLVEPGRQPQLADRAALARHFERLQGCLRANRFPEERDRVLVLLLTSTGALGRRLRGRDPRWFERVVGGLVPEPSPTSRSTIPPSLVALAIAVDFLALAPEAGAQLEGFDGGLGGDFSDDGGWDGGGGGDWSGAADVGSP